MSLRPALGPVSPQCPACPRSSGRGGGGGCAAATGNAEGCPLCVSVLAPCTWGCRIGAGHHCRSAGAEGFPLCVSEVVQCRHTAWRTLHRASPHLYGQYESCSVSRCMVHRAPPHRTYAGNMNHAGWRDASIHAAVAVISCTMPGWDFVHSECREGMKQQSRALFHSIPQ